MSFNVYQESSSPYQRPRHAQAKTEINLNIISKRLWKPGVDPIEVFKLVCTGRVISSRRSMMYMSKFILIYGSLEVFGICLLALESI
jgi:hypothetical protein